MGLVNMDFKYLRIGKIVNTQGIKGEVRVLPLTEKLDRFDLLKIVFLDDTRLIEMEVEYVKYHKNFVLIKFKGVDNMNEAEKLKDNYILVSREDAIELPEGSYFVCDLIGLNVYTKEGSPLGKVEDVLSTGSNDVYVVRDGEKEILIHALKTVVLEISLEQDKMVVDLPEGLV